ncbi:MAG: protein arginine kinase [Phycisphaerae bacterium]|nr:protein arginine kinase [Phycisphaerae bacterium]
MILDELTTHPGEWLRGTGPMSDVVISSRVRLARNIRTYPFVSKADPETRDELCELLRASIKSASKDREWSYVDLSPLDELDRQVLVERHLISRQHADGDGCRGVAFSPTETVALMVNEEDHLRMQSIRSGLRLDEVWQEINGIDDLLEDRLEYAFHPRYGYLTACPTNVGTGIRVSVMLHLPGLKLTNEIERVFRAARELRLAVRGLFGEGTEASGDFFQVSNQCTLGRSEEDIVNEFKTQVLPRVIEYERQARQALIRDRALVLDDKIWRSYGMLRNARTISSEETLAHLSLLRLGIHLERMNAVDLQTINELFLMTQPAHLQKMLGHRLTGEQRSAARAEFIRKRLSDRRPA